MSKPYHVAALYQFIKLDNLEAKRTQLLHRCQELNIKGTLILAEEGINGTIAGTRSAIDAIAIELKEQLGVTDLEYKESLAEEMPFYRLKIKIKKEIVTLGQDEVDPTCVVGDYIDPKDWNAVISDPETLVIDTRNDYEVQIGSFKGAINPETDSFTEFPEYVEQTVDAKKYKKVAMFCTGGIRCEKASSYMLGKGFEKVMHLKGGILKYLEEIPEEESLWEGDCFVFDNRVAVTHGLKPGSHKLCHGCRMPINAKDEQSPKYVPGVCCPHCADTLTEDQKMRFAERQKQVTLAKERQQSHIGSPIPSAKPK